MLHKIPRTKLFRLRKKHIKRLFVKADSLVDKISSCPRVEMSNSKTLILGAVETRVLLSDFAQQLHRKRQPFRTNFLMDTPGVFPTLLLNQNDKAKETERWALYYMNVRSCKDCTRRVLLIMALCAV